MTPTPARDPSNLILSAIFAFLICCGSVVSFVVLAPCFPAITLESWELGINVAVATHLVIGRDILFTFGPYAALYSTQYHPATDAVMLGGGMLLATAFVAGLCCLGRGKARVAAAGFALFLPFEVKDAQFLCLPMLTLLLAYRIALPAGHPANIPLSRFTGPALLVVVLALALLPLIKGTFAVASVLTMGIVIILLVRRSPGLAAGGLFLFAAALPAFWCLAQQPLAALPGYFIAQLPIISGYSDAVSGAGPLWQILLFVTFCLFLGQLHIRYLVATGYAGKWLLAGLTILLFLSFKEGFVRQDQHALAAAGMAAGAGWAGLLLGRGGSAPRLGLEAALACWLLIDLSYAGLANVPLTGTTTAAKAASLAEPYMTAARGLAMRLDGTNYPANAYASSLLSIRTQSPLPALAGPTDMYPNAPTDLVAAGLVWDPRPVLQSYSAYTPALERLDAAHLVGAAAPVNIIFAMQPIDGRLPALEDGASWPILLSRYRLTGYVHLAGYDSDAAILRRCAVPGTFALQPFSMGRFALGTAISLPHAPGTVLWANVDVQATPAGKLLALFFKLPPLYITYQFSDGTRLRYRYVAGMGVTGFVIAPLVNSSSGFIALAQSPASLPRPVAFTLGPASATTWLWHARFHMRLSVLTLPAN